MSEQPSNDGAPKDAKDAKTAWSDVSDRFTSWGRQVAERYRTREPDADAAATEETGRKLDDAARDLTEQLNRAFGALGDTLRDEAAKTQLKDAVRALGDAVSLTVSETADEIRKRMRSTDGATGGDGSSTPPASPD